MAQTRRYAAVVEYNGAHFHGWQHQKHHDEPSVQAALEAAFSRVGDHPITVHCAGRTDSGVHATRQVIHFDSHAPRKPYSWLMGTNTHLPANVAIQWLAPVADDFHARFNAQARYYRYLVINTSMRPALHHEQMTWWRHKLDHDAMHQAAQLLLGEHDFSAFRAKDCQAKSPIKTMHHLTVKRWGDLIMLEVKGSAFLYHMIRNIMGVLLPIGDGRKPVEWCAEVLASKDRTQAGITAPPNGLHFVGVEYPPEYAIPSSAYGPVMLEPVLQQSSVG